MTKIKTGALAAVVSAVALGIALIAHFGWRAMERWGTARHQRSIITELASWETEVSQITNDKEAFRAVDMLSYIRRYYVPGPGYHGDPDTESALEAQRARTLKTISKALEDYTGEKYGDDFKKWEDWKEKKKSILGKNKG